MWPFKKKQEKKYESPAWWSLWQELKEKYPVGRSFDYLGRKMIVSRHELYFPGMEYFPTQYPKIICEYADDHGVLHEWSFPIEQWKVLSL